MRHLIFVILMTLVGSAAAQDPRYSFTVSPNPPTAGQSFQLHVTLRELSCVLLPDSVAVTLLAGNIVQYELHMTDNCFPYPEQQRTYTVPGLTVGTYTLRLATCLHAIPPLPNEACFSAVEMPVTVVLGPSEPRVIPTLTLWSLMILICLLASIGLCAPRRT